MLCPNCSESMKSSSYDSQNVLHCSSCGASFFEENGINRITFDSALKLSQEKYRSFVSPKEKVCPKDFIPLTPISNSEAIPSHVILFFCNGCDGVFVYPDDLLKFKKAQGAKIDYYKSWSMPFASLKSVLIVFLIVVLSTGTFLTINTIQNRALYRSEAEDLFKSLSITRSGRYILLGFRTSLPLKSQITLLNTRTGKRIIRTISSEPKTIHQIVLTDIDKSEDMRYRISLSDESGRMVETVYKSLSQ